MSVVSQSTHDFEADSADSVDQLTERNVKVIRELEAPAKEERTASD